MRHADWIELARAVSLGTARDVEILRERAGDARVARVAGPDGESVVVKLWNRPGWRSLVRRWTRTNPARREWRTLCRLHHSGLFVPRPLAYVSGLDRAAHTEGVVSQDLGQCSDAVEHFKHLLRSGTSEEEAEFVRQVVRATAVMVRLGLLDTDHRLPNFVVTPDGRPVRLDFELNVRSPWPRLWTRKYGLMLGTLLGSLGSARGRGPNAGDACPAET